jgi:para-aminobenzoate synthetase
MKTLLIDNYDSYTFNLFQLLADVNGERPLVIRNDQLSWEELIKLDFDNIVISPGPGRPEVERDFGICDRVLREMNIPMLGVCLGHQGLGTAFGGRVVPAPRVMHGQLSEIRHNGEMLFEGIPQNFRAVRYHSLMVAEPLPADLEAIAWAEGDVIMALCHRTRPLWGVQFHPESISTEYGRQLIENFTAITSDFWVDCPKVVASPGTGVSRGYSVVPSRSNGNAVQKETGFSVQSRKLDAFYNPEQVFYHLYGKEPFAFWLDSSRVEEGLSRFSFIGAGNQVLQYDVRAKKLLVAQDGEMKELDESIFDYLDRELSRMQVSSPELPFDLNGGFVGYLGYELKAECGAGLKYDATMPDAAFIFAERLIAFDHLEGRTYLVQLGNDANWLNTTEKALDELPALPPVDALLPEKLPIEFRVHRPYEGYIEDIRQCKQYLTEGESYEICLTTQVSTETKLEPLSLYRHLRRINPAPYAAYLRFGENAILSSSPERFLRLDREHWVEAKPIKGTARRGATPEEDQQLRDALQNSEKNRAENLMIVDLLRNDLGLVCDVGSVHVPKLMDVESYSTVHQLVSTIRGRLRADLHVVDCIKAAFPGGSMTGAPKLRTMELIDQLEQEARGVYSGAIGFLGLNGTADLNIVIRTIVSTPQGLSMGAGGAITILSDNDEEYDEMLLKVEALVRSIVTAAHGEFDEDSFSMEEQVGERDGCQK